MKTSHLIFIACITIASYRAYASSPSIKSGIVYRTASGVQYGLIKGEPSKPLVMIFTTNIHDSLAGTFTPIGQLLSKAGFTIAAIDVTCHGKDVRKGEVAGLDCWASRVKSGGQDVFAPMISSASQVISDVVAHRLAAPSSVIAMGVSRGGYAALRLAASDGRVDHLILMAPVTDLRRLTEFHGISVDQGKYGFGESLRKFSADHVFMQIGNKDTRVGTTEAIAFMDSVVAAGGEKVTDFTTVITPLVGHGTAQHQMAAEWAIKELAAKPPSAMRAP